MDNSSETIDFEIEIKEFIDKNYFSKVIVTEKTLNFCKFKVTTLENEEFDLNCSVAQGIQVNHLLKNFIFSPKINS